MQVKLTPLLFSDEVALQLFCLVMFVYMLMIFP